MSDHNILSCRVFLQAVEKQFPGDKDRLARMSLIEGKCNHLLKYVRY